MVDTNATQEMEPAVPGGNSGTGEEERSKSGMLVSAIMFLAGLFVVVESLKMPTRQLSGSAWYTAPGIFPAFLGAMLMFTSAIMFFVDYRKAGGLAGVDMRRSLAVLKTAYTRRLLLALALLSFYIIFLLGNINYMLATFLYLAVSILVFDKKKPTARSIVASVVISALVAVVVGYCFENFAQIPLP